MSDAGRGDRDGDPEGEGRKREGGGRERESRARERAGSAGGPPWRGRRSRSLRLFGGLYWETRPPLAGVCYALAALFLFVPRSTVFWTVREPSSWLLVNYPDAFLWLFEHYRAFGLVCLVGALLAHLSPSLDRDA